MSKQFLDLTGLNHVWQQINNLFQRKLVSGINIKTINNQSLVGNGNITTPDTTYEQATADVLGLVKIGATGLTDKNYAVQLDSQGRMFVNVPWNAGTSTDEKVKQLAAANNGGEYESGTIWNSVLLSYNFTTGLQQTEETNYIRKSNIIYSPNEGILLLDEDAFDANGMIIAVGKRNNDNTGIDQSKSTMIMSDSIIIQGETLEIDKALTEEEITAILV